VRDHDHPDGIPELDRDVPSLQGTSLPYSRNLDKHVSDAAACTGVDYPHLVKPFQERIGSLMYATTSTRCDIAYPVVCAPCVWPCPGLRPPERGTAPRFPNRARARFP
jgi:hypothetical protein